MRYVNKGLPNRDGCDLLSHSMNLEGLQLRQLKALLHSAHMNLNKSQPSL